jgi:hypothetical protein
MAIIQRPSTEEGQIKFIQATRGVDAQAAKKILNSIGFDAEYNSILSSFENSYAKGMERSLGQLANAYNPANQGGIFKPGAQQLAQYKEAVKNFLKGNEVYEKNPAWKAVFSPEYWDRKNAAIASATSYFGKNFVDEVGGFLPGGSQNEFTVDYIGQATGQSQPQTFKINQQTGEIDYGEIKPVDPNNPTGQQTGGNTTPTTGGTTGWSRTPPVGISRTSPLKEVIGNMMHRVVDTPFLILQERK